MVVIIKQPRKPLCLHGGKRFENNKKMQIRNKENIQKYSIIEKLILTKKVERLYNLFIINISEIKIMSKKNVQINISIPVEWKAQ